MRQLQAGVLRASGVSAAGLLCIGAAEAIIRWRMYLDFPSVLGPASLVLPTVGFFAVLLIQLVRPASRTLTYWVAGVAALVYIALPAALLLPQTWSDVFWSIDLLAVTVLLSFTYSVRGWAAVAAAGLFVILLTRRRRHQPSTAPPRLPG